MVLEGRLIEMEGEQVSAKQIPKTFGQDGRAESICSKNIGKTRSLMLEVSMAYTATRIDNQVVVKGYTLYQ